MLKSRVSYGHEVVHGGEGKNSLEPLVYDRRTGLWVPSTPSNTKTEPPKPAQPSTGSVPKSNPKSEVDSKTAADKEYIETEFNTLVGNLGLTSSEKSIRLKVNDTIKLEGLGKYLSGQYFVSEIRRTLTKDNGYSHSLTVIKNGFGDTVKSSGGTARKKEVKKEVPEASPKVTISTSVKSYKERFVDTNGSFLDYWVHLPKNLTNGMPLVVFLHGLGEVGNINSLENYGLIASARNIYGDSFPFVALYPNTHIQSWVHAGVPDTLIHLINSIVNKYLIDNNRIILTGHSLGAYGVWSILNKYRDYFSCGVPVSGDPQETLTYTNFVNVPIRAMCGTGDIYENSYAVGMKSAVESINSSGGKAQFVTLSGKTHSQTKDFAYSRETIEWMIFQ